MNVDDRIRAAFRAEEIPPPPPGVVSPEDALAMEQQPRGSEMPTPEPELQGSIGKDIDRGIVRGVLGAATSLSETLPILGAPFDKVNEWVGSFGDLIGINLKSDYPIGGSEMIRDGVKALTDFGNQLIPKQANEAFSQYVNQPPSSPVAQELVQEITKFGVNAVTPAMYLKAFTVMSPFVRGMAWGGIADFINAEPTSDGAIVAITKGLAGATREERGAVANAIMLAVEKQESDPLIISKAREALDGMILGGSLEKGAELIFKVVGKMRSGEMRKNIAEAGARADERLKSTMSGSTLSANPVGAMGDMAVSAAGRLARTDTDTTELRDNVNEGLNRLAQVGQVDNVKRRTLADLHERIPPETRVAKDHIPGETMQPVSGGRFSDLDLNAPGAGFTGTQGDLDRLWKESVSESGAVAGETVARLGMSPRQLEFWDDALRLSARGRYWYEVSTESFKDLLPDLSPDELKKFISVVAATSPVANPFQNMQRTVAAFSAYLRGVPIDSDLVIPRAVRDALETGDLEGLKTGSFGGTMQFIDGLTDVAPLSTNDRQVASSFGVSGDDIAGNPELYEVLSRFYTKMRDDLNAKLPPGAEPYETWQLQALGWIQERTLSGNPFNDDYLDALIKIDPDASVDRKSVLQLLEEGGVNVPDGILTRDILMDPRVTDILSPTTPPFREAPIATIEVNTVQTMAGARASDLLQKAVEQGDDVAVSEFNKMTTGALYKASRGTTSPFSPMISAVIGKKIKVSRIEVPTSDRPFDVAGTYKGEMSPNIRVPLQGLSNDDINVVMAGMAKAWKQEGVPATRFTTTTMEAPPVEGSIRTYSVFVQTTDDVAGDTWLKFADALPEVNEISVRRVPNGYVLDIHPDYEKRIGPVAEAVEDAVFNGLGDLAKKASVMYRNVTPFSYETLSGADDTINAWKQRIREDAVKKITARSGLDADAAGRFFDGDNGAIQEIASSRRKQIERIRTLGQRRVSDFDKAVEQAQDLGGSLAEGQRKWAEKFGPRLEGTTKPELVKSTPAVERFLANPQGRPMPVTERP
jgi:hypothetical protein